MQHTRKAVAAVIGLVAALSLTACNGDDSALGGGQAGSTASADKAGGTGGTGGSGKTDGSGGAGKGDQSAGTGTGGSDQGAGTGGTGKGKVGMCRSGALDATAVDNTTDKTEGVVTVSFKNSGGDCRINGFAGVDIKTSLGDTFSVDRNGEQPVPEILKKGETAAFNITFPVNNTGGSGVKLTDMVVTPPNETEPFTLKWPAGTLPVTDGEDGGKMELSPVGKVSDSPTG
ncbi:DUF4232 domain-containing protein [Streptomyces termitum]|uniref:DUF4232 domain-containing protein n=1 Tax=Streptomyces termitum TaxID=67368 RepID=A0A918T4P5_9ACTN|nr:DUF4232 domain-containing protein [Streptomyces termitum]GHA93564.1 hypothetical protein GCM10010305_41700 [Streptomyces termitum]